MQRTKKKPAQQAVVPLPAEQAEVWTLAEAAAYLRITEVDVLQAIRTQGLPARSFGSEWRFLKPALQAWLSTPSRPKKGILAHIGAFKDDPELEAMLKEREQRRALSAAEPG